MEGVGGGGGWFVWVCGWEWKGVKGGGMGWRGCVVRWTGQVGRCRVLMEGPWMCLLIDVL